MFDPAKMRAYRLESHGIAAFTALVAFVLLFLWAAVTAQPDVPWLLFVFIPAVVYDLTWAARSFDS